MEREANLAAPHTVLAQALLEQRRHKEAVASAEAALGFDPQDLSAIRVEGRALLEGKVDVEQGIRLSRYYLDHSPPDNETRLFLAQGMRSAGRPASEVVDLLKAGIEVKSPDKPVTLYLELAQAYQDAGDPASALAVLDNLCAKGAGGDLVRWWRIRADVLRAQGNAPGAFDAYKQAVTLDPSNLTALERFATLLDTEQRFEEAARVWQQAADARPYDGRLKVNLALAVRSAGDNQRAWTAVKEAIEQGVYGEDRARAFLLRAELADILQAPHDELVEAYYEAGRQSYGKGDLNQALHWLDRATGLDTRHQDARWYRADTLRRRASLPKFPYWDADLLAEAGNYWRATLAFGPPNRDVAWSYVSGALIADGEGIFSSSGKRAALVWEAVAYLERSLVLDERNIYAWINLSRLHRVVGNNATALIASERALQIDPDDLSAIDERIGALANLGDAKGARDLIDKRLQREPTTWAEGANAFILYLEDHLPAAVEQIGRVIEADPE
jgi:tetratricopeptide (TPR) repeat protein